MGTRVWTIISKEWAEALRNKLVLITVLSLPIIISLAPVTILYIVGKEASALSELSFDEAFKSVRDQPPFNLIDDPEIALQIYLGQQFSTLYLILPLTIPMTIATYSVVGEKRERSLEPLLATPIRTWELILGKCLAAAIPGIISTWLGYGVFLMGVSFVATSPAVLDTIITPLWGFGVLVLAPLMTVMSTVIALIISSRVSDPRIAEQLGLLTVLPVVGLLIAQLIGWLYWDVTLLMTIFLGVIWMDGVMIWVATRFFDRERILTRWKF